MSNPSGLSDEDELKLLEVLKAQPDFECLPIPAYWFKKYGIPPREAVAPREYIESNYAMRKANEHKELPPILIDEPQQNGKLYPVAPPEKVDVELVSRPFVTDPNKPFPAVICPPNNLESDSQASPRRMSRSAMQEQQELPSVSETGHRVQTPYPASLDELKV